MDFKNLLSSLGALSNLLSNQNNPQPGQNFSGVQNAPPSSEQNSSVRYFPEDITSKPTQTQNFQNFEQNQNGGSLNSQNLLSNLSSILPLLGLIFGKNSNLSNLLSNNSNLGQILSLLSKQEEKKSPPPIDSYKKVE